MSTSRCPKCENSTFEIVTNSPIKSKYKYAFVQCSKCGSVVGVLDFYNIGTLIKDVENKVNELSRQIDDISNTNNKLINNQNIINNNILNLERKLNK